MHKIIPIVLISISYNNIVNAEYLNIFPTYMIDSKKYSWPENKDRLNYYIACSATTEMLVLTADILKIGTSQDKADAITLTTYFNKGIEISSKRNNTPIETITRTKLLYIRQMANAVNVNAEVWLNDATEHIQHCATTFSNDSNIFERIF